MPLSDEILLKRLSRQEWTAQNIRLSDQVTTWPGHADFNTDLRLHAIRRILSALYPDGLNGLRVADLGCLEGGFSLELAKQGMIATGVEAREKNIEKCRLLADHFELPQLSFVKDDVKNFSADNYGTFDVVLALGILYHLDNPVAWLDQIAETTRKVLIIESHYAPADDAAMALIEPQLQRLGPLKQIEHKDSRYQGRWFFEYEPQLADRENQLWASYSNGSSFWLTKESLLLATQRAGFDLVLEQHDYSAEHYEFHTYRRSRGMFVAIKRGGLPG